MEGGGAVGWQKYVVSLENFGNFGKTSKPAWLPVIDWISTE